MRLTITVLLSLALSACVSNRVMPEFHLPQAVPANFPLENYQQTSGNTYELTDSHLTVLLYRTGRLKHLGHNHVLTSQMLDGLLYLSRDKAYADFFLPVASFVVDNADARALAGVDFSKQPKQKDIEGTRTNLLGTKVLDANTYPYVQVHLERGVEEEKVQASITIKGQTHAVDLPVKWAIDGDRLTAESEFTLSQQALGLTPFSALGGAIGVADDLKIKLTLSAIKR